MTWTPTTEEQISIAIEDGNLSESAALDMKAAFGGSDRARKETAKDIASFAIEGGALLIGVGEIQDGRKFTLTPIPLENAMERIEQIAANRIDPPVHIRAHEIPSAKDPNVGYVWVEIPPSGFAPHIVDGIYYARGDRTTRRLTDAEVDALHQRRHRRQDIADRLLDEEIRRDPIPQHNRKNGHLYLVAEPLTAPRDLARDLARSSTNTTLFQLLNAAESRIPFDLRERAPRPRAAYNYVNRSSGAAMTSFPDGIRNSSPTFNEQTMLDIELHETGGLRLLCGRLTVSNDDHGTKAVLDSLAVAYTLRLVHWAVLTSVQTGYRGSWAFGIAGNGLRGGRAPQEDFLGTVPSAYDVDDYRQTTIAHRTELEDAPEAVAEKLIGPLLRGLDVSDLHQVSLRPAREKGV